MIKVKVLGKHYDQLARHLLKSDDEEIAFLIAVKIPDCGEDIYLINELYFPTTGIIFHSPNSIKYNGNSYIEMLNKIEKNDLSIVAVHSHRDCSLVFSDIDSRNDKTFIKNAGLFNQRQIHFTAIMNLNGEMKIRTYNASKEEYCEDVSLIVLGSSYLSFGMVTNKDFYSKRNNTSSIFGELGQLFISNLTIGIVGAGGNGSAIFEQVLRLGVKKIIITDFDFVETRNLSRLHEFDSGTENQYKVMVLANRAKLVNPKVEIVPIEKRVEHPDSVNNLKECDVIFGALDAKPYARAMIDEIKNRFYIPIIDVAMSVDESNDTLYDIYGRMNLLIPGESCMFCRKILYDKNFRAGPNNRHNGYVQNISKEVDPSLISFNTMISSMGVNMFIQYIFGYLEINPDIKISMSEYVRLVDEYDKECNYCLIDLGDPFIYV